MMCVSPFSDSGLRILFIVGQGLSFSDRFREQEDRNPELNKSVKTHFLSGFSANFSPSPPPFWGKYAFPSS